jgi:hypothetical protein
MAKVGVATNRRVEVVKGEIPVTLANEAALRRALEAAGIEFIEGNGGGEGVGFRKPPLLNWAMAQFADEGLTVSR